MTASLHAVVIAGGSGTRFWPLSRQSRPKQLLTLDGKRPLLTATFERVQPLISPARFWMVVGERYGAQCREAVPQAPAAQVLTEPQGRNTAPAIGLAALHVAAHDPEGIMAVLPADHHVADPAALRIALDTAAGVAAQGAIVTLGITPTRPETGYGYIERGAADARADGAFRVKRFCEKPDLERARGFLARGGYDWNAGIFVLSARTALLEIERQLPNVWQALARLQGRIGTPGYESALAEAYAAMPSISFDYGVMEGARDVSVVPTSCGWSDVGSFNALESILVKDAAGNLSQGRVVEIDTRDCVLLAGPGQVLAAVGVSGLAVVQTKDATLVVPLDRAQEVRGVLDRMGQLGWEEHL